VLPYLFSPSARPAYFYEPVPFSRPILLSLSPAQVEMMTENAPSSGRRVEKIEREHRTADHRHPDPQHPCAHHRGLGGRCRRSGPCSAPHGLIWFSLIFTITVLLFTEILPKTMGVTYARQLAPYITVPSR
jgi:hypothetical protein